jgi:hypothetical protein
VCSYKPGETALFITFFCVGTEVQKTSQLKVIWCMFELFFFITFGLSDERAYSVRAGPFKQNNLREKRYFLVDRTPIPTLGVHIKISNKYIK